MTVGCSKDEGTYSKHSDGRCTQQFINDYNSAKLNTSEASCKHFFAKNEGVSCQARLISDYENRTVSAGDVRSTCESYLNPRPPEPAPAVDTTFGIESGGAFQFPMPRPGELDCAERYNSKFAAINQASRSFFSTVKANLNDLDLTETQAERLVKTCDSFASDQQLSTCRDSITMEIPEKSETFRKSVCKIGSDFALKFAKARQPDGSCGLGYLRDLQKLVSTEKAARTPVENEEPKFTIEKLRQFKERCDQFLSKYSGVVCNGKLDSGKTVELPAEGFRESCDHTNRQLQQSSASEKSEDPL